MSDPRGGARVDGSGCGVRGQGGEADIRKMKEAIEEVRRSTDNLILEQQALIAEMNELEKGSGRPQRLTAELEALKQKVSDISAELEKTSTTLREKQQLLTSHRSRFGTR
jgi:uncharacterized protein YicC (UPF0701 family)